MMKLSLYNIFHVKYLENGNIHTYYITYLLIKEQVQHLFVSKILF